MSQKEAKALYMMMLSNDELNIMLPSSTGDWSLDKNDFMKIYEKNQAALSNTYLRSSDLEVDESDVDDVEDDYLY